MTPYLRICCITLVLCIGATGARSQTDLRTLQTAAEEALIAGEPAQTVTLAQAIIAENPDSFAGHFLLALALSDLEDHAEAAKAAGRAYRNAPTENDKLQSARLAGSSRFAANQYARSELWLRRAANHVETEQEIERVVREFQRARTANPISLRFGGQIAPSNNVNNGAESATFRLEGIDLDLTLRPDQVALAGTIISADVRGGYDLSKSATQTTTIGGYIYAKTIELTPEAQESVSYLPSDAFDLYVSELSFSHQRQIFDGLGPTGATLRLNRAWSAYSTLSTGQILDLRQVIPLGNNGFVTISGSLNQNEGLSSEVETNGGNGDDNGANSGDDAIKFSNGYDLSAQYATTFANNDSLQVSLQRSYSDGGFENIYTEYQGRINYSPSKPFLNISWSLGAELGYRTYDAFFLSLDGRRDTFGSLTATGVFDGVSYFGFSPSMTFSAKRTESDVDPYTTSQVGATFGVQSSF